MRHRSLFFRPSKKLAFSLALYILLITLAFGVAQKFVHPAPPRHIVISAGDDEGDYLTFANQYKEVIEKEGVQLEVRRSSGSRENLTRLLDPKSGVDVAFVQDGLNTTETDAGLVSLGSLYYEPLWVFYRGKKKISRFSQLTGKRVAIGERGGGTPALAWRLFKLHGIDKSNTHILHLTYAEAVNALKKGTADVAFFIASPEDDLVKRLLEDKSLELVNLDQAEAITRQLPYLHHLVLPSGALDLKNNIPAEDIHLVAPTATLVARDTLHPALVDLLLTAAIDIHGEPGIFEQKGEFPIDKDYYFPISSEAKRYYKSGAPFWQRYLPFWVATLVDRFILVAVPILALLLPLLKMVPKFIDWRFKSRIYRRYGELKYLETQVKAEKNSSQYARHLAELDRIEERVNHMKIPLELSDHLYVLREHIDFVRGKLSRALHSGQKAVLEVAEPSVGQP